MLDDFDNVPSSALAALMAVALEDSSDQAVNAYSRVSGQRAGGADDPTQLPDLAGYQFMAKLGEGGMGTVWRAVQLGTRREVALKLLNPASFGSERAR
jgi:serine/threonine protein kinase